MKFLHPLLSRLAFIGVLLIAAAPARSDELPTARQTEIMRGVLSVDGSISQQLHEEFWQPLKQYDRAAVDRVIRTISGGVIAKGAEYQRALWRSAQASFDARRVVRLPELDAAETALRAATEQMARDLDPQGRGRGARILAENLAAIAKAGPFLEAAATRGSYQAHGQPMFVTPELISQVLGGLDASIARLEKLFSPTWSEARRVIDYPDAGLRVISDLPFNVSTQDIAGESGHVIRQVTLEKAGPGERHQAISSAGLKIKPLDPAGFVVRCVRATLSGAGVKAPLVTSSPWRGALAASGTGLAVSTDGSFFVSARCVWHADQLRQVLFLAITEHMPDAVALRETLERDTQLIDR